MSANPTSVILATSNTFNPPFLLLTYARPRSRYPTFEERLESLRGDPFVRVIRLLSNQVQCSGCDIVISLNPRKPYPMQLQDWKIHKEKCHKIKEMNKRCRISGHLYKNSSPGRQRSRCSQCQPDDVIVLTD